MECNAHPPWITRWKDHAKNGMLVFKEMLDRVQMISLLTCTTMRIHDPTLAKENRPVPCWAFHAYGNYQAVLESVAGITEEEEKNKGQWLEESHRARVQELGQVGMRMQVASPDGLCGEIQSDDAIEYVAAGVADPVRRNRQLGG